MSFIAVLINEMLFLLEFSEDVTAICAPDMSADYRQGQLMQISGWGTTNMCKLLI